MVRKRRIPKEFSFACILRYKGNSLFHTVLTGSGNLTASKSTLSDTLFTLTLSGRLDTLQVPGGWYQCCCVNFLYCDTLMTDVFSDEH